MACHPVMTCHQVMTWRTVMACLPVMTCHPVMACRPGVTCRSVMTCHPVITYPAITRQSNLKEFRPDLKRGVEMLGGGRGCCYAEPGPRTARREGGRWQQTPCMANMIVLEARRQGS